MVLVYAHSSLTLPALNGVLVVGGRLARVKRLMRLHGLPEPVCVAVSDTAQVIVVLLLDVEVAAVFVRWAGHFAPPFRASQFSAPLRVLKSLDWVNVMAVKVPSAFSKMPLLICSLLPRSKVVMSFAPFRCLDDSNYTHLHTLCKGRPGKIQGAPVAGLPAS